MARAAVASVAGPLVSGDRFPVTGRLHQMVLTAQEMPGAFEIRCTACHRKGPHGACDATCHLVTWTPWGEDTATEIAQLHLFYMAHPLAKRLHQDLDRQHPGRPNRR